MPSQSWSEMVNPRQAANLPAAVAYASSAVLTDVSPGAATNASLVLPANFLEVGGTYRVRAAGTFSNTGTPTLLLGVYWGGVAGTALATSGAVTTTTGATNWPWLIDYEFTVRSVGSSGTVIGDGKLELATALTAYNTRPLPAVAIAAVTVNTTAAAALTIGGQWGTLSASNTLTCTRFSVTRLY